MYPPEFDYYAADSVEDALALLAEHDSADTELLAGGHSLIPAMKSGLSNPEVLVDIGDIAELQGVEVADGTLSIGAATTYADVIDSDAVREHAPALADATAHVGDRQVRNCGTIGGNLAHADPASDLAGGALAADATLVLVGEDGERRVPADDFFWGMYATDLGPQELLASVEVSTGTEPVGAYAKKPSPSSGYALVGVAAQLTLDGDRVATVRIGANGAMDHGVRLEAVEDALREQSLDEETIATAAERATDGLDTDVFMEDMQASAEFRAQLLRVYTKRALTAAFDRAPVGEPAD